MLISLSAIASKQAKPTKQTLKKVEQFLDYATSQEDAVLTYHASNMVLAVHSDASHLSESKARRRAGGHFFHGSRYGIPSQQWRRPHHCANNQSCHGVSGRGGTTCDCCSLLDGYEVMSFQSVEALIHPMCGHLRFQQLHVPTDAYWVVHSHASTL